MLRQILRELKHHIPFTLGGAFVGIVVLVVLSHMHLPHQVSHGLFAVLHPAHVLLSAMVTTGMYILHGGGRWWAKILIGYIGSIGIATLSDCLIPYLGEVLRDLPHAHVHAGFIEEWYLVTPAALGGTAVACFWPKTRFPHAGHVLLSTFASLAHMLMAMKEGLNASTAVQLAVFLFLAVWIPCCTSDIVFPLLFVKKQKSPCRPCQNTTETARAS